MSKKHLADALKIILGVGIASVLLYFIFQKIDWNEFWEKAQNVNYWWVVLSILLSVVAYFARAYRWNMLLETSGYKLSIFRTTLALIVGYFANLVLPRIGEVTRCGVLKRYDNVPMPVAIGSVITERIFDLIVLILLFFSTIIFEGNRLLNFFQENFKDVAISRNLIIGLVIVGVLFFGGMIFLYQKRDLIKGKFSSLIEGFVEGLLSIKNIKNPVGFIASTVIIWTSYYFMTYVVLFSIPETSNISLLAGMVILTGSGVALAIPVQGGFGTYHAIIAGILVMYGVVQETGIFIATLLHTSQILSIAVFGAISLLILSFMKRKAIGTQIDSLKEDDSN